MLRRTQQAPWHASLMFAGECGEQCQLGRGRGKLGLFDPCIRFCHPVGSFCHGPRGRQDFFSFATINGARPSDRPQMLFL